MCRGATVSIYTDSREDVLSARESSCALDAAIRTNSANESCKFKPGVLTE